MWDSREFRCSRFSVFGGCSIVQKKIPRWLRHRKHRSYNKLGLFACSTFSYSLEHDARQPFLLAITLSLWQNLFSLFTSNLRTFRWPACFPVHFLLNFWRIKSDFLQVLNLNCNPCLYYVSSRVIFFSRMFFTCTIPTQPIFTHHFEIKTANLLSVLAGKIVEGMLGKERGKDFGIRKCKGGKRAISTKTQQSSTLNMLTRPFHAWCIRRHGGDAVFFYFRN